MINLEKIVRPNIIELEPYTSARDDFSGSKGIFLDANENPYGHLNRYPDPYQLILKQHLSGIKHIDTDQIFIGNGSDEIIDLAIRIFCCPGIDKAMAFSPTYGMYDVSAAINQIGMLKVPLTKEFQIDIEYTRHFFSDDSIKLVFICSPNNPTGNLIKEEDILKILNQFNGIVIIDEAYIDFAQSSSLIRLIKDYDNLIVLQTMSKAWGLAAARIGIAYTNVKIASLFNKVKPPYNVSSINQQAAIDALANYPHFEKTLMAITKERERLKLALEKMTFIEKVYCSDANFLLAKVKDIEQLYAYLIKHQIVLRNRHTQIPNCVRISVGTIKENDQLIKTLKSFR